MARWTPVLMLALAAHVWAQGQGPGMGMGMGMASLASKPVVEVKGTIAKVQIEMGAGMPSLEVATAKGKVRLVLGSMRYLMEQGFNPKAGEAVEAKGYQLPEQVVAIRVELPASKKTLLLRDEEGYPVWMRGRRGPMMEHQ
jgi:hypothetical protein